MSTPPAPTTARPLTADEADQRAELLTALKLPTASAHVGTHNIDAALRALELAAQQTNPKQRELYLKRADQAATMARQNMISAQGEWREYNHRADRLIRELVRIAEELPSGSGELW